MLHSQSFRHFALRVNHFVGAVSKQEFRMNIP